MVLKRVGVLSIAACAVAHAQEPEETARESVDEDFRAVDAREDASDARFEGSIPFERILAAPDDVDLNLAYARERIVLGDLKEGAATLERVLLMHPDRDDVRVLYGLVLFRMGVYDRARFELEKALEADKLPPTVRAEAEVYLRRIKRTQQRTNASVTLTAGVDYDSNRNQAPADGLILFADIPLTAESRNGDAAWIGSISGRVTHKLGAQEGHTLFAEGAYYRSDKVEVDTLDLDAVGASVGGTWNWGRFSVTPRLRSSFIWLEHADYLSVLGGEIEVLARLRPDLRAALVFRGEDEKFRATPNFLSAPLRSGRRLSVRPSLSWNYSATMAVSLEGLYMDKQGAVGFESYDRYGVRVQHTALLGRGAFALVGLWAEKSDYDAADAFVSPSTVREEWLYRARVSAGAPLSFFTPGMELPDGVSDINLILQYEYETVDANIVNFEYDTHKISILLSKSFAF